MRTPLLQSLVRLTRDAAQSSSTSDAPSLGISRRAFVGSSAAAAAGVSLSACSESGGVAPEFEAELEPRAGRTPGA